MERGLDIASTQSNHLLTQAPATVKALITREKPVVALKNCSRDKAIQYDFLLNAATV